MFADFVREVPMLVDVVATMSKDNKSTMDKIKEEDPQRYIRILKGAKDLMSDELNELMDVEVMGMYRDHK